MKEEVTIVVCFKLSDGVMVAQRFLAPFVGVRVPIGQPFKSGKSRLLFCGDSFFVAFAALVAASVSQSRLYARTFQHAYSVGITILLASLFRTCVICRYIFVFRD